MSVIEEYYDERSSFSTEFAAGVLPDWLSTATEGGASVSVEATNGGRAVLSTGTTSTGDIARLKTNAVTPNPYDAVLVRATIDTQTSPDGSAVQSVGFEGNNYLLHFFNHNVLNRVGTVRSNVNGDDTFTRDVLPGEPLTTELLWDTVDQRVIHRYQNAFGAVANFALPDPSANNPVQITTITDDTAADRVVRVYDLEVAFLDKK